MRGDRDRSRSKRRCNQSARARDRTSRDTCAVRSKMTTSRSSVIVAIVLSLATVLASIWAEDATTVKNDNPPAISGTSSWQRVDTVTDTPGDQRQGRMSLHTELPSSKAKREQALRNILAARRRQIFGQRSEPSGSLPSPALRSNENTSTESSDILEAQETRHEIYIATADAKTEASEDDTSESSTKTLQHIGSESSNKEIESSNSTSDSNNKHFREKPERDSLTVDELKLASKNSRNDPSTPQRNMTSFTTSSGNNQKVIATENDSRKKNTVPMPESLYNHFRPVESNIPIEDMSQFLYFGQKLHPEVQNMTGNNSVEATPTASTSSSSRRRNSMKRFGTTTSLPIHRLEEIVNEEMNIAVERRTVEKNKVSKIKNAFRNGNGLYYRKSRPDSTIASNVIPEQEIGNVTDIVAKNESIALEDKSVHGTIQDRSSQTGERGSTAHVLVLEETRNATQIPKQQPVSANTDEAYGAAESEIDDADQPTSFQKETVQLGEHAKVFDANVRRDGSIENEEENIEDGSEFKEIESKIRDSEYGSTKSRIPSDESDHLRSASNSRESNNVETSRDSIGVETSNSRMSMVYASRPETSTLRIVVTEENPRDFALEAEFNEGNTVKTLDFTQERFEVSTDFPSTLSSSKVAIFVNNNQSKITSKRHQEKTQDDRDQSRQDQSPEQVHSSRKVQQRYREESQHQYQHQHQHQQQQQQHQHQNQQQQHVYAYTITNVTRQLRNYTGPGLSREERGPRRGTGTGEITSGSARRRGSASASPETLPRADSGIEATRALAELSAGATVEPVTAGSAADAFASSSVADGAAVGERRRKLATGAQPQSHQRAPARTTYHHAINKTSTRNTRPHELTARGSIRWNHTKPRNADLEASADRRFLRKSASAVLNQRIGSSGVEEDNPSVTFFKRRRISPGWTQGSFSGNNRRSKGSTTVKVTEESITESEVPSEVDKNISKTESSVQYARKGGNVEDVVRLGRVIKEVEGESRMNGTTDSTMEASRNLSTVSTPFLETNRSNNILSSSADNATVSDVNIAVNEGSRTESTDTKDESVVTQCYECKSTNLNEAINNVTETMTILNANDTSASVTGAYERDASNATTTEILEESTTVETVVSTPLVSTISKSTTTTVPPPVFPVTPKMLTEENATLPSKETFTLKPGEAVNQVAPVQPADSNRPFGMAVDLDPSEIQRMYRQGNSSRTDPPPITTIIPDIGNYTDSTNTADSTNQPEMNSPMSSTETPRYAERSPEVRGRNLYDKSRDKDDVLPIMHLYHTSDIFNGSSIINSVSRDTERPPIVELSTDESTKGSSKDQIPTDEIIEFTTTATTTTESSPSPSRVPTPSRDTASNNRTSTKKDRLDDNRNSSSQDFSTGPSKASNSSNFSNGASNNRTRHRPAYHHVFLPEYNGSMYPTEINRTFFETGLFSIGSRDPVNISEVISKRHDGDAIASQETVTIVSYILATLVVFPIAVGVGLILRRLIIRNRKVLEESDTSSEISCRKDALNLENGDFKTSIEKAITKLPRIQHLCHEAEKPPPPPTQQSRWEFPRDKLRLQTVLGQGNFGQVWKAEADDLSGHQGTTRLVAVKTVKEGASDREKEDLVRELEIMQQLGSHPNVVTLLGCCTEEEPHYLILEYVMYGKLLAYLRDHRTRQDFYNFSEDSAALTSRDLTVFGYCVARGMEYLASKKIIHRDLAARNVLVDHNKLCKIADFGMSRFANEDGEVIETRHGRNALPIRWMAPESLIYSLFTTKTDVWSFGILMWEIVTLGSTPYPDMTAREVMRNVQSGYRLERPSHCRSELFRVISRCWHDDPDRRPEFQTLRRDLAQLLEDNMNGHYVDLESFASECTD